MNQSKPFWTISSLLIVIVILFFWSWFSNPNREVIAKWKQAGVNCLAAHEKAGQHIHQHLFIRVDGEEEGIPVDTGIVRGCMAEVHVHEEAGELHVETVDPAKKITLGQFMTVYGKSLTRAGYRVTLKVDAVPSTKLGDLVLEDGQTIELDYESIKPDAKE